MSPDRTTIRKRNWSRVALWVIRGLLGAAFLAAGSLKLAGAPMMVAEFNRIGLGQWFRYFTAICEISGAILIVLPLLGGLGALLLVCVMSGAVLTELLVLHDSATPAAVLGILALIVLITLRGDVYRILRLGKKRNSELIPG